MSGPKLLARYLARSRISYPAFAKLVRADRARIHRYAKGQRSPSLGTALAIEEATRGAVPASSWAERPVVRRRASRASERSPKSN